jgi:hypothetical protein
LYGFAFLICKDKDDVVAEYALDDISQPIGIVRYKLTKVLRDEFKSSLPTIEETENVYSPLLVNTFISFVNTLSGQGHTCLNHRLLIGESWPCKPAFGGCI